MQPLSVNSARGLIKTFHHGPVDADPWKVAVDRPGPLVEALGDRIERFPAIAGQVGTLRQVLAEEPMGVLAGPALPRAIRVAAGDLDPSLGSQLGMACPLLPLVIGQRLAQGAAIRLSLRVKPARGEGVTIFTLAESRIKCNTCQ